MSEPVGDDKVTYSIIRFDASVIVKFHCAGAPLNPVGTGTYPESNPPLSCSQGAAKEAWDTVWFPGLGMKSTSERWDRKI